MIDKISEVIFANKKLEKDFQELRENDEIKKGIKKAIKDIKRNPFIGTQIPKKLIHKKYIKKYGTNNIWKYDFPNSWRLIYSITIPSKVEILTVLIKWFNHKNYERRFNYSI